jgi:hypothetical protein
MTKIINFFAGPGSGKSSLASGLFSEMKWLNINCELVTEFAKDLFWEDRETTLKNQIYVTAKQYNKIHRLVGKVDYVLVDSPLLLGIIYREADSITGSFDKFVLAMHKSMMNVNYFVRREKPYHQPGRSQSQIEAKQLDVKIIRLLRYEAVPFKTFTGEKASIKKILKDLELI